MESIVTIADAVFVIEQQHIREGKTGYLIRNVETDEPGFIPIEELIDSQH